MKNISIKFTLIFSIAIFVLMILVSSLLSYFMLARSNESTELVHKADNQVILINDVYKNSARTRAGFALVYANLMKQVPVEPWVFKNIQTTYGRMTNQIQQFNSLPVLMAGGEEIKAELFNSATALAGLLDQASQLLQAGNVEAYSVLNIQQIDKAGARFSTALEKYQKNTQETVNTIAQERQSEFHTIQWVIVISLLIAAVLTAALLHILKNRVFTPLHYAVEQLDLVSKGDLTSHIEVKSQNEIGQLLLAVNRMQKSLLTTVSLVRGSSDSINTSAKEIAAGNLDLSSRTEQQASSLEETAASMEELTGTVKQNAENAKQANQLAHSASSTAGKGGEVVAKVVDTMDAINTSSRKIVDIISVIDGIAFQTNILALNAAVEAARAGEQGRGFAVVASEVRSLAQRSAAAAKEIKELINDSVDKVAAGSQLVEEAGLTMNDVVSSVQRVTDIVGEIAEASREQSSGIEQINQAISQMDNMTQQNAALVEEAAAAAQSLQTQAVNLVDAVGAFRLNEKHAAMMPKASSSVPRKAPATASAPAPAKTALTSSSYKPKSTPVRIASEPTPNKSQIKNDQQDWEEF